MVLHLNACYYELGPEFIKPHWWFLHSHVHVSKNKNAHKLQRVTDKVGNRHILDVNSIAMIFLKKSFIKAAGRKVWFNYQVRDSVRDQTILSENWILLLHQAINCGQNLNPK